MPALTIFHDTAVVQVSAPYGDPSIHCNLSLNDNHGGRIVIALSKPAFDAVALAIETFQPREALEAAALALEPVA